MVDESSGDIASVLVDLDGLTLSEIEKCDRDVLATALQQIYDEADHPEEAQAGFSSSA